MSSAVEDEHYDNYDPAKEADQKFLAKAKQSDEADSESEPSVVVTRAQKCHHAVKHLLHSHYFHILIVVLIVVDCFCVMGEIIIDYIDVSVTKHDLRAEERLKQALANATVAPATATVFASLLGGGHHGEHHLARRSVQNSTNSGSGHHDGHKQHHGPHQTLHHALEITEDVLKYISLGILVFFIIEILLKLIFTPRHFLKSKLEIMDAIVVVVSFVVGIVLINIKHVIHSFASLLIIVRIWRITEIVNSFLVLEKEKNETHIKALERELRALRKENAALREDLLERQADHEQLQQFDRL